MANMNDALPMKPTKELFRLLISDEDRAKEVEEWVRYVVGHSDVFGSQYIGYWARGYRIDLGTHGGHAWLVHEFFDAVLDDRVADAECAKLRDLIRAQRRAKQPVALPECWHLLDREAAERAYRFAERCWGEQWYGGKDHDATTEDIVLQLALLGELRYG